MHTQIQVNQYKLRKKVEKYLKIQRKINPSIYANFLDEKILQDFMGGGWCAGLTNAWTLFTFQDKTDFFFKQIREINAWDGEEESLINFYELTKKDKKIYGNKKIADEKLSKSQKLAYKRNKLVRTIERLVSPIRHLHLGNKLYQKNNTFKSIQLFDTNIELVTSKDKTKNIKKVLGIGYVFTSRELKNLLEEIIKPNVVINFGGFGHKLGITLKNGKYVVYNSNNPEGEKECANIKELLNILLENYYNILREIQSTQNIIHLSNKDNIPVKIFIYADTMQNIPIYEKSSYYLEKILEQRKKVKSYQPFLNSAIKKKNNIRLAIECSDKEYVELILKEKEKFLEQEKAKNSLSSNDEEEEGEDDDYSDTKISPNDEEEEGEDDDELEILNEYNAYLKTACLFDKDDIVELLINKSDTTKEAFEIACKKNNKKIIDIFLKHKAYYTKTKAIIHALKAENIFSVKYLLKKLAPFNLKQQKEILLNACFNKNLFKFTEDYLQKNIKPNILSKTTITDELIKYATTKNSSTAKHLIEKYGINSPKTYDFILETKNKELTKVMQPNKKFKISTLQALKTALLLDNPTTFEKIKKTLSNKQISQANKALYEKFTSLEQAIEHNSFRILQHHIKYLQKEKLKEIHIKQKTLNHLLAYGYPSNLKLFELILSNNIFHIKDTKKLEEYILKNGNKELIKLYIEKTIDNKFKQAIQNKKIIKNIKVNKNMTLKDKLFRNAITIALKNKSSIKSIMHLLDLNIKPLKSNDKDFSNHLLQLILKSTHPNTLELIEIFLKKNVITQKNLSSASFKLISKLKNNVKILNFFSKCNIRFPIKEERNFLQELINNTEELSQDEINKIISLIKNEQDNINLLLSNITQKASYFLYLILFNHIYKTDKTLFRKVAQQIINKISIYKNINFLLNLSTLKNFDKASKSREIKLNVEKIYQEVLNIGIKYGYTKIVKFLVEKKGIKLKLTKENLNSICAKKHNLDLLRYLISKAIYVGMDVNTFLNHSTFKNFKFFIQKVDYFKILEASILRKENKNSRLLFNSVIQKEWRNLSPSVKIYCIMHKDVDLNSKHFSEYLRFAKGNTQVFKTLAKGKANLFSIPPKYLEQHFINSCNLGDYDFALFMIKKRYLSNSNQSRALEFVCKTGNNKLISTFMAELNPNIFMTLNKLLHYKQFELIKFGVRNGVFNKELVIKQAKNIQRKQQEQDDDVLDIQNIKKLKIK